MRALERLLEGRLGLDCASLGPSALAAALSARMQETGCTSEAAYVALASSDEREMQSLVEEVVVPETWFMRDGEPFAELVRAARRHQAAEPFRVLTVPCATGEEPFSVAISLLETGLAAGFSVEAVDVSQRALAQAALGVFSERSFRGDVGGLRKRWFSRTPAGWAIDDALKQRVSFRHGNVLDPMLGRGARYDAIFCRNLLIYLGADGRSKAIGNLKRALAPGGTLFVGHAESLERMEPAFVRVGPTSAFAYRLRSPDVARPAPAGQRPSASGGRAAPRDARLFGSTRPDAPNPLRAARAPAPEPPAAREPDAARAPDAPRAVLREARQLADTGRLEEAQARCEAELLSAPADPQLHALLGVVLSARGDLPGAQRSLERALYLDPDHEEAIAHLIVVHERLGDVSRARALAQRAARVRGRRGGAP